MGKSIEELAEEGAAKPEPATPATEITTTTESSAPESKPETAPPAAA